MYNVYSVNEHHNTTDHKNKLSSKNFGPSLRNLAQGGGGGQKLKIGDLGGQNKLHPLYINHISQGGEIVARKVK